MSCRNALSGPCNAMKTDRKSIEKTGDLSKKSEENERVREVLRIFGERNLAEPLLACLASQMVAVLLKMSR